MGVAGTGAALLEGLNPAQLEAVTYGDGPLLVVAGAGSGKTRVLTRRIGFLLAEMGIKPWEVLAITFTNKAAAEMKKRVAQLVGPTSADMWVSTFHSACVRMLRRHAPEAGYRPGFSIYDQADATRLARYVLEELNVDTRKISPRATAGAISAAKSAMLGPNALAERATTIFERRIAQAYGLYQARLRAANAMDFDDLIMVTAQMLRERPGVADYYRARFRHILVDEYQDTNAGQNELVVSLGSTHRNVCVVGDTDQSVYGFRGADITNIMEFSTAFPEARTIKLEQNYRSTQNILDAANAVIAHNQHRQAKNLWTDQGPGAPVVRFCGADEHEEAGWVAGQIRALGASGEYRFEDMAIFYRANAQSRVLEEELVRNSVPYKVVGGTRFYDRREIKDVLAYLRVLANPTDEVSLRRILNVPKRGVGNASVARLDAWVADGSQPVPAGAASLVAEVSASASAPARRTFAAAIGSATEAGVTGRAATGLANLAGILAELRELMDSATSPGDLVDAIIDLTGYRAELQAEASQSNAGAHEAEGRLENLDELAGMAHEYQDTETFLEAVALVSDADEIPDDDSKVVLMTLHTAKGLEFEVAFLVGMEDGVFPHMRSLGDPSELEEERRLCYVGITRARRRLFLTNAWCRSLWGAAQYNPPSRFLDEIPDGLVQSAAPGRRLSGRDGEGRGWGRQLDKAGDFSRGGSPAPLQHPVKTTGAEDLGLGPGDAVVHSRWGEGRVVSVRGEGDKAEATINFAGVGTKQFLLALTPLKKA
ncbi:MAG: UvrD-helicase domain-containing protein [Acidimicrobiales bacterium]